MLSLQTCIELIYVLDNLTEKELDRIFNVFNMAHLIQPSLGRITRDEKCNIILRELKNNKASGPFSNSFQLDMVQYKVDQFYRYEENPRESSFTIYREKSTIPMEDRFTDEYKTLANSLKRDGYIVKGRIIKKLLPEEIEEAATESELMKLLDTFKFTTAKGHLEQARKNHSMGNWAGANSQFRPFIEALLIGICNTVLPKNNCDNASSAIKLLGSTANPPFLRADLNEVESNKCDKPFVEGLWKRLHPEGSHPGLSDEEDSTFRYHITIVFSHYLLKRLEKI